MYIYIYIYMWSLILMIIITIYIYIYNYIYIYICICITKQCIIIDSRAGALGYGSCSYGSVAPAELLRRATLDEPEDLEPNELHRGLDETCLRIPSHMILPWEGFL